MTKKKTAAAAKAPDTIITITIPGDLAMIRTASLVIRRGNMAQIGTFQYQDSGDLSDAIHSAALELEKLEKNPLSIPDKLPEVKTTEAPKAPPQITGMISREYEELVKSLTKGAKYLVDGAYVIEGASHPTVEAHRKIIEHAFIIGASAEKPILKVWLKEPPVVPFIPAGKPKTPAPPIQKMPPTEQPVQAAMFV